MVAPDPIDVTNVAADEDRIAEGRHVTVHISEDHGLARAVVSPDLIFGQRAFLVRLQRRYDGRQRPRCASRDSTGLSGGAGDRLDGEDFDGLWTAGEVHELTDGTAQE